MRRPKGPIDFAVADLSETVTTRWRGYVDRFDPAVGVHGWALTADSPVDPIELELVVGDIPLHRISTTMARADIASILGVPVTPGFKFPTSIFGRLAHLNVRRRELTVRVRFAGTHVYLRGSQADPTVGELVDAWCQWILAPRMGRRVTINPGDRLLSQLSTLRADAEKLLELPLRPTTDVDAGRIEAFHPGTDGQLWFSGWVVRGAETEFPLVLIDRHKYPGGAVTLQYERQDLASRYVGVIGLLNIGWMPTTAANEYFLHAGAQAALPLRAGVHTQIVGFNALLAAYRQATASLVAGNAEALGAVLSAGNQWVPGNAAAAGIAADASIDRLLLIPGFGCIAEGWAVSPARRVRTFQMKVGDAVLVADEVGTYFWPRPDLSGLFGGSASVVARGGFVTALRGELSPSIVGAPLLRVIYDDGSSSVHPVEPKLLHQLDFVTDSAEVLRLYPSLRHEPFYPALLAAIRRQLAETGCDLRAIAATPTERAVVIRLPDGAANQRLCFDFLTRLNLLAGSGIGVCFVVDDTAALTTAKLLFHEFRNLTDMPLSLFCLGEGVQGFAALPALLATLLADRFVYLDRGTVLTAPGWAHAIDVLGKSGHAIHYFEFIDDTGAPDRINGVRSAACFGWTTAAFFSWLPSSTPLLRGVRGSNGLPPAGAKDAFAGAAIRLERQTYSRLAEFVDDDLLSTLALEA